MSGINDVRSYWQDAETGPVTGFKTKTLSEEEHLRKKHPGLQEAWDKYQLMLKLCKVSNPDSKDHIDFIGAGVNVGASRFIDEYTCSFNAEEEEDKNG